MSQENNDTEPENQIEPILDDIANLLQKTQPLGEMRHMDEEVAQVLTTEEYMQYLRYKTFCLEELSKLNLTPGLNDALYNAIERGFIIGYWFGMKHRS